MRLSDAIRLGSLLHPQYFGDFYGTSQETCALGAAGDAVGKTFVDIGEVIELWPWIEVGEHRCPAHPTAGPAEVCGFIPRTVAHLVPHLNDDHRWTREQIADWVATVEPGETNPAAVPTEAHHVEC